MVDVDEILLLILTDIIEQLSIHSRGTMCTMCNHVYLQESQAKKAYCTFHNGMCIVTFFSSIYDPHIFI